MHLSQGLLAVLLLALMLGLSKEKTISRADMTKLHLIDTKLCYLGLAEALQAVNNRCSG